MIDLHISIQESLHADLQKLAEEERTTKAHLVREALSVYLTKIRGDRIEREMRAYAERMASDSAEFVQETDETIDRTKLGDRKVGSLSSERMKAVETAILNYLGIEAG